jgi:predicted 2-oxoglutarate/Fe(II)-dependent dioxygenase YbiX
VVLCFFGSASAPVSRRLLDAVVARQGTFDGRNVAFFGVSVDPDDERLGRVPNAIPGVQSIWDFDRKVSRLFGAQPMGDATQQSYTPFSVLLDERLRVVALAPLGDDHERHMALLMEALAGLPSLEAAPAANTPAPILNVPRIFEPALCRALIRHYEEHGGGESGFMRDMGGKTVGIYDYSFKRRRDQEIADEPLRKACMVRIADRLVPEIRKAFQFHATRIERYIVACYDAETRGHFRAHRDDTTRATAHRKFAVSIVLNTGEFEGGDLRFAEFGRQGYSPSPGGAIVFSCSLLHELTPVTRGKRYAFLPFLYDEANALIRRKNAHFLAGDAPKPR